MYTIVEGEGYNLRWAVFWDTWGEFKPIAQFESFGDAAVFVLALAATDLYLATNLNLPKDA